MAQEQTRELVQGGKLQVEVSCRQDEALHFEKLGSRVQAVAEKNIFFCFKGVYFVVLAGHKEGSHAEELKVLLGNEGALEHEQIIDYLHAHLHGFILDLKLSADLEQPLDKNLPHFCADLRVPEVRVDVDAAGDLGGEGLVVVDEVLDDVREVGEELGGT